MEITLNGAQIEIEEGTSLSVLVSRFDARRIAVEINGEIAKRSTYDTRVLEAGDQVEVVTFVGGG